MQTSLNHHGYQIRVNPSDQGAEAGELAAAIAGCACTRWVVPHVDNGRTRTAILVAGSAAAIALVGKLVL